MQNQKPFSWIIDKLKDYEEVESTNINSNDILTINRKNGTILSVSVIDVENIDLNYIEFLLNKNKVDFILYTFKNPVIHSNVYEYIDNRKVVLGNFSDLFKIIGKDTNWPSYELRYIWRGLIQHTKVSNIRRLNKEQLEIERYDLDSVIIIIVDDYDIGIEAVRRTKEQYNRFDAILKSNPNGIITSDAQELANTFGIKLFSWRELLSKLNKRWN